MPSATNSLRPSMRTAAVQRRVRAAARALFPALLTAGLLTGCLSNRSYYTDPGETVLKLEVEGHPDANAHAAIIEFDDFGQLWRRDQLEDAIALIEERNAESENGLVVVLHAHGWMNNANPKRSKGDLPRFKETLRNVAVELEADGAPSPDGVVGIYVGWRGATTRVPLFGQLTFWNRLQAAERVASYDMREAIFRVVGAADTRQDTKILLTGHSMGGLILAKTLGPSLSTMLLSAGDRGVPSLADLVVLQNPALDALSSAQLIDFLVRSGTVAELRTQDGRVLPAEGPVIVAITSEVDWVTKAAYPAGQVVGRRGAGRRHDQEPGKPTQWRLATRAVGHVEELISHRAWVEGGEVRIEPVPGAYNTTPFWVVQVSSEISSGHSDVSNERFRELVRHLTEMNSVYDSEVQTWLRTTAGSSGLDLELFGT